MPVNPSSNDETSMNQPQPKRITIVMDDSIGPGDDFDAIGHLSQYSRQRPGPVKYQARLHPTAILIWSSGLIFCGVCTIIIQAVMLILDHEDFDIQLSTGIWSGVVCIIASILGFCSLKHASKAILWVMVVFAVLAFAVNITAIGFSVFTIKDICKGPPDFTNQQCRVLLILSVVDTIFFVIGGLCSFAMVVLSSQGICCFEMIRDYKVDSHRNERTDEADGRHSLPHVPIGSSATIVPLSTIDEDGAQARDRPQSAQRRMPRPGQFVDFLSGKNNSGFVHDEPTPMYSTAQGSGPKHGTPFDPKDFRDIHLRQVSVDENRRVRQDLPTRPSLKRIISQQ